VGEGTKSIAVNSKDKVTGNEGSSKPPDAPR
jgi:hypothetical protein